MMEMISPAFHEFLTNEPVQLLVPDGSGDAEFHDDRVAQESKEKVLHRITFT
jgi:hypothetical protein